MTRKVTCTGCGVQILASTAAKTKGLCRPCQLIYRRRSAREALEPAVRRSEGR